MDHRSYSKLIAKAWSDPEFAGRLFSNPSDALSEAGVGASGDLRTSMTVSSADGKTSFHIPGKPANLSPGQTPAHVLEDSCHVADEEEAE